MKKIYPVIHAETFDQTFDNINIAYRAGADGVFLVNHSITANELFYIYRQVSEFPYSSRNDFHIGINCLDLDPFSLIFELDNSIPMIWTDNALINENTIAQKEAQAVKDAIEKCNWRGQYFGGVAFKYQKSVDNLEKATEIASNYVDVVTTSGPATGVAASPEKLKRMKSVLGEKSLAIASGITVDNVLDYRDSVDIFLVSTGISKDFLNLDEKKVKELVDKIRYSM